jgi:RNA polymerase sigma-70 factor (ECF subfamily)
MSSYGAAVYRFCREMLRDAELGKDVQQQVFIEAFRDLPKFAWRTSLRTWLFGIARNRVLDAVKRRQRRGSVDVREALDEPDAAPPLGERLDDTRLKEALVHCFGRLPEPVRAAVVLRYQHGFTFDEISAVTGDKPGTAQARVSKALLALRVCIERTTGGSP